MASDRAALLASIASTIADYRSGEIVAPDAAHVDRWVSQFDAAVQLPILAEMAHVLKQTYITRLQVETFVRSLVTNAQLGGDDPCTFWRRATFLNIQGGGNSQREMLAMFDRTLRVMCGIGIAQCGSPDGPYIYLDDVVFTGSRVKNDLIAWLNARAPAHANVHIIVIGYHRYGQYYAGSEIEKAAAAAKKALNVTWWWSMDLEDRKKYIHNADVLRPSSLPRDALTQAYVKGLKYPVVLRPGTSVGEHAIFSSDTGRCVLEQEMLKAGVHIRSKCPYLNAYQRPLGNMILETLGFGALLVTFRNCPNNAPLAWWAGDPWYPLFPRKTN